MHSCVAESEVSHTSCFCFASCRTCTFVGFCCMCCVLQHAVGCCHMSSTSGLVKGSLADARCCCLQTAVAGNRRWSAVASVQVRMCLPAISVVDCLVPRRSAVYALKASARLPAGPACAMGLYSCLLVVFVVVALVVKGGCVCMDNPRQCLSIAGNDSCG